MDWSVELREDYICCLFLELRIQSQVSELIVRHDSTYIISFLTQYGGSMNNGQNTISHKYDIFL